MHSFWQRLERVSHRLTPATLVALTILLAAVPIRLAGVSVLMPEPALIGIYYWGIFWPGSLPYLFLFLLGMLKDSLAGNPLGISSLIYIAFAFLVTRERRAFVRAHFAAVWLGFGAMSAVALALTWLALSVYFAHLLSAAALLVQWAATALAYPYFHLLFARIGRRLADS